jgi:hypothetical protein
VARLLYRASIATRRAFPHYENGDVTSAASVGIDGAGAMTNIAIMGSRGGGSLRVGIARGNFNADNRLVTREGRIIDYAPVGFLGAYVSWHLHIIGHSSYFRSSNFRCGTH